MNQILKNQYYDFIHVRNYETFSIIDSIFNEIDTLLLINRGKNQKKIFLKLIEKLKFTENDLYQKMKQDIENGVLS